jgi:hypothetical protein
LPFKIEWIGYNRLDLIASRPHTAQLLLDSGLKASFFGIESFNPKATQIIGKGWNGKHAKDFLWDLREIWKDKISITGQFIAGLPEEHTESIIETNEWLLNTKLIDFWIFGPLAIHRYTQNSEFERNYGQYGIRFNHPLKVMSWEHDLMNWETAIELSMKLNIDPRRNNIVKTFSWHYPSILMYGEKFDKIMKLTKLEADQVTNYKKMSADFLNEYYNQQLNY